MMYIDYMAVDILRSRSFFTTHISAVLNLCASNAIPVLGKIYGMRGLIMSGLVKLRTSNFMSAKSYYSQPTGACSYISEVSYDSKVLLRWALV